MVTGLLYCALPLRNLELDDAHLAALDQGSGRESLRFWESPEPVVVLGRSGSVEKEVVPGVDVPVVRRSSGGGAVVLAPGCLNFSLVLSIERHPELVDVAAGYCLILKRIAAALALDGLEPRGASDLAWRDRKVSGNSQRRTRHAILHHGTLLYEFDPAWMDRYLQLPPRQPAWRRGRSHRDFVANLPLAAPEIIARIEAAWMDSGTLALS